MTYLIATIWMIVALLGLFATVGAGWLRLGISLSATTGALAMALVTLTGDAALYYGAAGLIAISALECTVLALIVNALAGQRTQSQFRLAFEDRPSRPAQRRTAYASTAPDIRQSLRDAVDDVIALDANGNPIGGAA